jgi:citrate synthase
MSAYIPGLQGVIAARTRLSRVDGQRGRLLVAGYDIEDLALNATYEEALFTLWYDRRPSAEELAGFRSRLAARRELPPAALAVLRDARDSDPMDALRAAAGALGLGRPLDDEEAGITAVAAFPTIVAAHARLQAGNDPIAPRSDLGHAANLLWMLDGEEPDPKRVRGLDTYLVTVMDHGLNASTFAARVVISTGSDVISAMVAAVGALKGPLHGGAPGPALETVFEIGRPERAEAVLREKLARGERLMGFGHRVYKVRDPRAEVLSVAADRMLGGGELYALARHVEEVAIALLDEQKPGRSLRTNVEFYTALLLHGLGLETARFTPVFAAGRVGGWVAHALEQRANGRLLRPDAEYVGAEGRKW